ncbi:acetate kinase [Saccharolobus caldissimus]|uniref:Acetate kinase n=2 Tax=Saccharolobus caldissimus TaxID=1702097 RepID=A0AAQ4CMT1_9CREN|nr:acetate kinase [Saccharolobus caldissimus]
MMKKSRIEVINDIARQPLMIFVGIDPGSETYAFAFINELGSIVKYFEIPSDLVEKDSMRLAKLISNYNPVAVALPSGHGLPFYNIKNINNKEIFLLTLKDPNESGPLRNFLLSAKQYLSLYNSFTIPSVIELNSVPIERKIDVIDMGTADKVCAAFFYRIYLNMKNFILVEMGRKFTAILIVIDGKIVNGYGGTYLSGLDGEVAYLLHKYSRIDKSTIYSINRNTELIRIIAEWYSIKYNLPIIVSGYSKDLLEFGIKYHFKFKEAAVGAAFIANAYFGGSLHHYTEEGMLESSLTSISFVRLRNWQEIISWIETL